MQLWWSLLRGEVMTWAEVQKTRLLAERSAGLARSPNSSNWSWHTPENIHRSRNLQTDREREII